MENNKYLGKIKFIDKKGKRVDSFSNEDILSFEAMNGRGIYIFLSSNQNTAYVGKSVNILDRLKTHIRATFVPGTYVETNSYQVLEEDDVEMYCCFTEDIYNYNNDAELDILEGVVMDAVVNSGYELVNYRTVKYDIDDIENEDFDNYIENIQLSHDMFRFGLKDILKDKMLYFKVGYIQELELIKQERDSAISKLNKVEKKNNRENMEKDELIKCLKESNSKLSESLEEFKLKIEKLESEIDIIDKKRDIALKKYKRACNDIVVQKEYYTERDLKNEEYLKEIKEIDVDTKKSLFVENMLSMLGSGLKNSIYEEYLYNLGYKEFSGKLRLSHNVKKFEIMMNEVRDNSSFIIRNIDYSKVFTEYGVLEHLRKRTYLTFIYFYKFINSNNNEEKTKIIDEFSEILYNETCKLFDNFKRGNLK